MEAFLKVFVTPGWPWGTGFCLGLGNGIRTFAIKELCYCDLLQEEVSRGNSHKRYLYWVPEYCAYLNIPL